MPLARTKKTNSAKGKFDSNKKLGLEWTLWMDWEKHFEKNPIQKMEKPV